MERKDGYFMNPDYEQAKRMALENVVQKRTEKQYMIFSVATQENIAIENGTENKREVCICLV